MSSFASHSRCDRTASHLAARSWSVSPCRLGEATASIASVEPPSYDRIPISKPANQPCCERSASTRALRSTSVSSRGPILAATVSARPSASSASVEAPSKERIP
eukprot:scaffold239177_cov28-Tisochrysis_lutea.AAC.2